MRELEAAEALREAAVQAPRGQSSACAAPCGFFRETAACGVRLIETAGRSDNSLAGQPYSLGDLR